MEIILSDEVEVSAAVNEVSTTGFNGVDLVIGSGTYWLTGVAAQVLLHGLQEAVQKQEEGCLVQPHVITSMGVIERGVVRVLA